MTEQEHKAIIYVCILAAFADGNQSEAERAQIQRILDGFSEDHLDLSSAYQDVLGGKVALPQAVSQLQTPASKALAYEMAVCLCNADGVLSNPEQQFLTDLRQALHLNDSTTAAHQQTAQALAAPSFAPPVINDSNRDAELDHLILNAAIMNGALELMPHSLATMAIVPLQMRMVYQIGNRYGFQLDSGHIKEFLATVGIGLTSQVFEGFTRRLIGGFTRSFAGGLLGGLATEATGSAFGFATTYALGQVSRRYYAGGRILTTAQLQDVFSSMLSHAKSMQSGYAGDIAAKSRQVNISELLPLVRGR
jgi:uncharacterized protein (DUF697 family)/tellurite resistance protein